MIPKDRPVRGSDFQVMERAFGLRAPDMMYLLGLMPQAYYALKKNNALPSAGSLDKQRPSITQAVMLRVLSEDRDVLPIPRAPTAKELFDLCKDIDETFTARHLAVLLGRDGTAGYKWIGRSEGSSMRLEVERLMLLYWLKLNSTPVSQRKRVLQMFMDNVVQEAIARGYDHELLRSRFRFQPARVAKQSEAKLKRGTIAKKLARRRTPAPVAST
ncbi:hypothetical protein [Dolichospermum phage Dfl-JY45]